MRGKKLEMFLQRLQGIFISAVQIEARSKKFEFVRTADYTILEK